MESVTRCFLVSDFMLTADYGLSAPTLERPKRMWECDIKMTYSVRILTAFICLEKGASDWHL